MIKFDDPSFSVELLRCDYCTNGSIKYPPASNLASTVALQHALRERHASPPCACTRGTNLTNAACLCTQEAPSTCRRSVPNGRFRPRLPLMRPAARSVRRGGATAVGARQQVLAAGLRAISSTPRDVSGLLDVLLVLNDVLAHPAALHLFAFVSRRCGTVLHARSVMPVHGGAVGVCCLNADMLPV